MAFKVGVVGLGNMGGNMATTLKRNGLDVQGFDPSPEASSRAAERGIILCPDLQYLAESSDIIILSLPKAAHVEDVCLGKGELLEHAKDHAVIVDTTTSTPEMSRKIAKAAMQHGVGFIDAPVSGGPAGAAAGTMTMVIGGSVEDVEQVHPVLTAMSKTQVHIGDVGAGNVAKIANNFLTAAHLISNAEAFSMAHAAGIAPEKLLAGINAGSGRSGVSEVNFPQWVLSKAYDSGFTMGLMRKDVGLAEDLMETLGLDLPLAQLVAEKWRESKESLPDEDDFSCIVERTDPALFGRG